MTVLINLCWLSAILVCGWKGWSNGLLAIIAITLFDMNLDLKGVRQQLVEVWPHEPEAGSGELKAITERMRRMTHES